MVGFYLISYVLFGTLPKYSDGCCILLCITKEHDWVLRTFGQGSFTNHLNSRGVAGLLILVHFF
jgi:hypothetical protein